MKRAVIIEDQILLSEFVSHILEDELDCSVVAKAGDGESGFAQCLKHKPHLVMLDLVLPKLSGMSVLSLVRERLPETQVVVVSANLTPSIVKSIAELGAAGLFSKETTPDRLKEALSVILEGAVFYGPEAYKLLRQAKSEVKTGLDVLSPRERRVLRLVGEGLSSKEIADLLSISVRTVDTHRGHIMRKLDLRGATDMTRVAVQAEMLAEECDQSTHTPAESLHQA